MKFKAHIKLTKNQSKAAVRLGLEDTKYHEMEFTLKDLAEHLIMVYKNRILPSDLREYLIPWLLKGNYPDIVELDDNNDRKLMALIKGQEDRKYVFQDEEGEVE